MKNNKVKEANLAKEVSNNNRKTYLYLVLELPPKRLWIEGYRIVLGKFAKAAQSADPTAVVVQCKNNLEVFAKKAHTCMNKYIAGKDSILESVI